MLLAYRLVKLIERHSDGLAVALQTRIDESDRCAAYHKNVPREDLTTVVGEIYRHLGEWLLGKSESDIETRYRAIGEKRFKQNIPLSQVLWTIALVKENLWAYVKDNNVMERPAEIFGELEMLVLLDQFISRAMYYSAVGYESAQRAARQNS
jgi:hypothetical protein